MSDPAEWQASDLSSRPPRGPGRCRAALEREPPYGSSRPSGQRRHQSTESSTSRAGSPATSEWDATSRVTTLPAPTTQEGPNRAPFIMIARAPIQTLSETTTGLTLMFAARSEWAPLSRPATAEHPPAASVTGSRHTDPSLCGDTCQLAEDAYRRERRAGSSGVNEPRSTHRRRTYSTSAMTRAANGWSNVGTATTICVGDSYAHPTSRSRF